MKAMESEASNLTCQNLPSILSTFIDTFIDFSVSGGLFLLPKITQPLQTIFPSPNRLIAIGDLHGDLSKTKQAFKLAGLIDDHDKWSGGSTTVVQIGDVLDRGGEELKILYFLEKLKREAFKVNGNLITMNGNHEIMNVDCDFRYVTKEGLQEFQDWAFWYVVGNDMKKLCNGLDKGVVKDPFLGIPFEFSGVKVEAFDGIRTRIAALRPNGLISKRFFANNQTVVVVGDSVFVHGGLLTKHVEYGLENVNKEVRDWICGVKGRVSKDLVRGRNSIVWLRKFSNELAKDCDCSTLEHVLATIPGAKRMIMGHTIQVSGINGVCDNQAIRIDVGMSKGCTNGLPEVLEIDREKGLRILTSNPLYQDKKESSLDAKPRDGLGLLLPELGPKQVEVKA